MSDARSLLRNSREIRRINHPHVKYTGSGRLLCTICNTTIKSEQFWSNHLKNPDHAARVQKLQAAASTPSTKKRKVDDDDDVDEDVDEGRKRIKGTGGAADEPESVVPTASPGIHAPTKTSVTESTTSKTDTANTTVEEDPEWAELQRAIDASNVPASKVLPTSATISAPAMSAEEIAAQAREEESVQRRGRRDEELEGEKEDAARALEDEFREMEELEDRVRKLREKREALRAGGHGTGAGPDTGRSTINADVGDMATKSLDKAETGGPGSAHESSAMNPGDNDNDDVDDDDDDDDADQDFDRWTFGAA